MNPRAVVLSKALEMANALESTPDSVGYTSAGLLSILRTKHVQALSLNSVAASRESLRAGAYPLSFTFALIHREDAEEAVQSFVKFAQGPEALRVLEVHGYFPVEQ